MVVCFIGLTVALKYMLAIGNKKILFIHLYVLDDNFIHNKRPILLIDINCNYDQDNYWGTYLKSFIYPVFFTIVSTVMMPPMDIFH